MREIERRRSARWFCGATVEWRRFNAPEIFEGRILNCGPGGACIEAPLRFAARGTLSFRVKRCPPTCNAALEGQQLRSFGLADVRWIRQLPADEMSLFAMGLKYIDND